jgi:hypothetical protein
MQSTQLPHRLLTSRRLLSSLAAVVAFLAVAPAAALATNRYVGVGGSTTDPACNDAAKPCDLMRVLDTVANAGDDVTVEPGSYQVPQTIDLKRALNIHGQDGAPRPTINAGGFYDASPSGFPVLRYLDLELGSDTLFFAYGDAEELIVVGGNGACTLDSPQAFRDDVCVNTMQGAAIDAETNGGSQVIDLRNDTALAPVSKGVAIQAATQQAGGSVTINLFNTIARGGPDNLSSDLRASTLGNGTATINSNHSNWAKAVPSGAGAAINGSVTDQHVAPVLVPGTYREGPKSTATIGKGYVDPGNGQSDFEGDLRAAGGATDIGADQFVAAPAVTDVAGSGLDGHATITATIDTKGSPTRYSVIYGATTAYGSQSQTFSLAPAASTQTVSVPLSGLTPGATYHFALVASNNGGAAAHSDQTFTGSVTPPPGGSAGPSGAGTGGVSRSAQAPQLGALVFSHSVFAVAGARPGAADIARRGRAPIGARITYTDTQAATTTFTISRRVAGFVSHGRCVTTRVKAGSRRCSTYVTVGFFKHRDRAGTNRFTFTGRMSGRTLRPGRYRMTAVPVNAAGKHGRARAHAFRIVR